MKTALKLFCLSALLWSCNDKSKTAETHQHEAVQHVKEPTVKTPLSPHTSAMAMIGDAHIHIDYSSPGVRDRMIFGGLLAYDQVWQAGAHMATWIETNKDLIIDSKTLPAGKYGFFTIPSKEEWTIMINSNWDQHGKDEYDASEDVIRFKVKPIVLEEAVEHLEYKVIKTSETSGRISLAWEKLSIEFPFEVKE